MKKLAGNKKGDEVFADLLVVIVLILVGGALILASLAKSTQIDASKMTSEDIGTGTVKEMSTISKNFLHVFMQTTDGNGVPMKEYVRQVIDSNGVVNIAVEEKIAANLDKFGLGCRFYITKEGEDIFTKQCSVGQEGDTVFMSQILMSSDSKGAYANMMIWTGVS